MLLLIQTPEVQNGRAKAVPEKATKILKKWERGDSIGTHKNKMKAQYQTFQTKHAIIHFPGMRSWGGISD